MTNQLFEAALGIKSPWFVQAVAFDASQRRLTVGVDFAPGSRFAHPTTPGEHPVYDTQIKRLRHLNFFQHECQLEVRVPRVRLPDGKVALVEPDWVGKLSGFTLLFEALVLMLAQQMTFAAVARIVGETWHRVHAICSRYVDLALTHADLSAVDTVAIDETSYKRGHNYLTLAADADARKVVFVTDGRDADTIAGFAAHLRAHKARAWLYREQLRDILHRKQINVVSAMLGQWCTNVMRSKVEPMKEVAAMIRKHFDGIVAWTQTRQTTGFVEAINGLFQAAKRKARGYTRLQTMRTVLFLIAGKLNFSEINPHTA